LSQLMNMPIQPNDFALVLSTPGSAHSQSGKVVSPSVGGPRKQQHHCSGNGPSGSKNSRHVVPLTTSLSSPNLLNTSAVLSSCSSSESEVRLDTYIHNCSSVYMKKLEYWSHLVTTAHIT
jgi:hypothetical protein